MVATFFGHRDTPQSIEPILQKVLIDLIENKECNMFYVGNHGAFDRMVLSNLKKLKKQFHEIEYYVVLAYMSFEKDEKDITDYSQTIYPEGLENIPQRFCILKRNKWMLERADYVITYVVKSYGGAAEFKKIAEKKRKKIIELADI